MAWAIRNGETEIGFTLHYMDAELDTGQRPRAGQRSRWTTSRSGRSSTPKFGPALGEIFPSVLERVERGDPGDPQDRRARRRTYSFFEPEYAWIDWTQPAVEIERQVRAWRFHSPAAPRGALTELDGETVRVLSREPANPQTAARWGAADGTLWIVETEAA